MEEILVLGQIPFTNINLSFTGWLIVTISVFAIYILSKFIHTQLAELDTYLANQRLISLIAHRSHK